MRYIIVKNCKVCPYRMERYNGLDTVCFRSESLEIVANCGVEVETVNGFPTFCPLAKIEVSEDTEAIEEFFGLTD